MKKVVEIVDHIDTAQVYGDLTDAKSGGICVFIGTVREFTEGQKVQALQFEAYKAMALKEMNAIADQAMENWNLNNVVLRHAIGEKKVTEPVVIVGASAAHRNESFEACRFLIDTLKQKVPIWKKEIFKDKTVWVSAHP